MLLAYYREFQNMLKMRSQIDGYVIKSTKVKPMQGIVGLLRSSNFPVQYTDKCHLIAAKKVFPANWEYSRSARNTSLCCSYKVLDLCRATSSYLGLTSCLSQKSFTLLLLLAATLSRRLPQLREHLLYFLTRHKTKDETSSTRQYHCSNTNDGSIGFIFTHVGSSWTLDFLCLRTSVFLVGAKPAHHRHYRWSKCLLQVHVHFPAAAAVSSNLDRTYSIISSDHPPFSIVSQDGRGICINLQLALYWKSTYTSYLTAAPQRPNTLFPDTTIPSTFSIGTVRNETNLPNFNVRGYLLLRNAISFIFSKKQSQLLCIASTALQLRY